jgi:hypothetical protein
MNTEFWSERCRPYHCTVSGSTILSIVCDGKHLVDSHVTLDRVLTRLALCNIHVLALISDNQGHVERNCWNSCWINFTAYGINNTLFGPFCYPLQTGNAFDLFLTCQCQAPTACSLYVMICRLCSYLCHIFNQNESCAYLNLICRQLRSNTTTRLL